MYIIVTVLVVSLTILYYFDYKFSYWKSKGVYHIKPTIPFGNIHPLQPNKICTGEYMKILYDEFKKRNKSYGGVYVGPTPILLLTDPGLIKTILVKDYKHFYDRGFHASKYSTKFEQNLIVLFGKKWQRLRSKISPGFAKNKMKMLFNDLLEYSKNLDMILNDQEPVDIQDIMSRLVLDNIALTTLDYYSNTLHNKKSYFYESAKSFIKFMFATRLTQLLMYIPQLVFLIIPFYIIMILKLRFLYIYLLKKCIKHRQKNNIHKDDFVDLFMKLTQNQKVDDDSKGVFKLKNNSFSITEMASFAFSFCVAGFHTTELAITFGLLQLSLNQNIQNKLRENIEDTLEKHQGNISYDSVMEMEYLEQVTCEILRMYPIVPVMIRECNDEYKILNSDFIIEKGIKVWISILGLHMDPEYYPNPTEFNPDRFTQEQIEKRKHFTYLPFGEGHRICIGKRFGLLQIKLALVKLIRSYRFTVDSKTILPIEYDNVNEFLESKNKIWLNLSKITDKYYL